MDPPSTANDNGIGQRNKATLVSCQFESIFSAKALNINICSTYQTKGKKMNAPVDFKAIEGMFERRYSQIEVKFDPEYAVAWTYMNPSGVPCFNLGLLNELRQH